MDLDPVTCGNDAGRDDGQYLWIAAMFASIVSSFSNTFGQIFLKQAQARQEASDVKRCEPIPGLIFGMGRWWLGFAMVGLIPLPFDMLAFSLAAQSLITPIGGITLILTQIIAPKILGEIVRKWDYIVGAIILFGIILTSAFGSHQSKSYTLEELKAMLGNAPFLIMEIIVWTIIISFLVIIKKFPRKAGTMLPVMYAFVAGALGGQMQVLFKGVGEMLQSTIQGEDTPYTSQPQIAIPWTLGTVIIAVSQVSFLNQGLALFDCVLFTPLYCAWLIINGTLFGAIYYQEFACFEVYQYIFFFLGMSITVGGIIGLNYIRRDNDEVPGISDSDDEFDPANDVELNVDPLAGNAIVHPFGDKEDESMTPITL